MALAPSSLTQAERPGTSGRHGYASDGTGSDGGVIGGTAGHDISRRDEALERSLLDSDTFVTR